MVRSQSCLQKTWFWNKIQILVDHWICVEESWPFSDCEISQDRLEGLCSHPTTYSIFAPSSWILSPSFASSRMTTWTTEKKQNNKKQRIKKNPQPTKEKTPTKNSKETKRRMDLNFHQQHRGVRLIQLSWGKFVVAILLIFI